MKYLRNTLILGSLIAGLGVLNSGVAHAAFESFGSDIPLELAAKQIVPEGYSVDFAEGVDKDTSVSWSSAPDWQSALSSAVAKKGLKAEFGSGTVVIVKGRPASTRPYSSTPDEGMVQRKTNTRKTQKPAPSPRIEREAASTGGGGFSIRPYRTAPKPPPGSGMSDKEFSNKSDGWQKHEGTGQFIVEEGYMLHATLNTWAQATGWHVVWDSQHDYLIQASATFSGDFVKASSDLILAMGDARPTITVDYYQGNNVIVVSNKLSDEVNH